MHSFTRVLDPANKSGRPWPLYPIAGARDFAAGKATTVTGVAAVDDSTVRITLDTAARDLPKVTRNAGRIGGAGEDFRRFR